MNTRNKKAHIPDNRKYLRLDTVFPVQFRLTSFDEKAQNSDWLQGFTNNIGPGGICLRINNPDSQLLEAVQKKKFKVSLEIEIPVSKKPISATANFIWIKDISGDKSKFIIGLNYDQIASGQNKKLMRYAWFKKLSAPVTLSLLTVLFLTLGLNSYINFKLTKDNQALVHKLSAVLRDSALARKKIERSAAERKDFQAQLKILQERMVLLKEQREKIEKGNLTRIKQFNEAIAGLSKEKADIVKRLELALRNEKNDIKELSVLDEQTQILQKANFDKMYKWLKIHQNNRTGLVVSFEGDKDIDNWSFTYDLALLVQVFTQNGDFERAKKILDFFAHEAKRPDGWFLNAYYVNDGGPAEFIMHSGPNIWVGLAIMQYTQKANDSSYLGLAESIAQTIIKCQEKDAQGGICGGPTSEWFSTEHNLDAYAFFNMLARVTQNSAYKRAADKSINWIVENTYDRVDLPVKRGRGDSTIATDTYAWSIAAIGPDKLLDLGMDPDKILEFVEENCSIETNFSRDGQIIKIKGFDFAPQAHTARGGVVSSEWTGQMIVSYKIMQDFYARKGNLKKAEFYKNKAQMYLNQLSNMIISSSSASGQGEGCLPYATQEHVDTGHGWMTPKGSHTGSVSGTVYALFAYSGFNPLELKE